MLPLPCPPPKTPLQCRDGWYLLDGDCIASCPSQFASSGVGLFKRRCAEPFLCRSARLVVDPPVNYGCKCANDGNTAIADCQICEHRASEYGQHCLKCNAGKVGSLRTGFLELIIDATLLSLTHLALQYFPPAGVPQFVLLNSSPLPSSPARRLPRILVGISIVSVGEPLRADRLRRTRGCDGICAVTM